MKCKHSTKFKGKEGFTENIEFLWTFYIPRLTRTKKNHLAMLALCLCHFNWTFAMYFQGEGGRGGLGSRFIVHFLCTIPSWVQCCKGDHFSFGSFSLALLTEMDISWSFQEKGETLGFGGEGEFSWGEGELPAGQMEWERVRTDSRTHHGHQEKEISDGLSCKHCVLGGFHEEAKGGKFRGEFRAEQIERKRVRADSGRTQQYGTYQEIELSAWWFTVEMMMY